MNRRRRAVLLTVCILLGIVAAAFAIRPDLLRGSQPVVDVYCAHDAVFAQAILDDFQNETGIRVEVHYDTEATKSTGLVNQLKLEKDNPRCDVFWNNELLGTMDLAREGALDPYKGSGYRRIPANYKDDDGRWTGFAARMRVWIVNTKKISPTRDTVIGRFHSAVESAIPDQPGTERVRDFMAIAKPMYGTTLTHYSILWQLWGPERLKEWHAHIRKHGVVEVAGNARVKDAVAEGVCEIGWTDSDDFYEAVDAGKPVAMLPILVERYEKPIVGAHPQYSIVVPNTVAIMHNARHRTEAEQLVNFLLSEKTELALAKSKSRQIPLGIVEREKLPKEVVELRKYLRQSYDLRTLEAAHRECLGWLTSESP